MPKKIWSSENKWLHRKFRCAYCGKTKKGLYRWVDGQMSCGQCNRQDEPRKLVRMKCPLCHGSGYFTEDGQPVESNGEIK